MKRRLFTIFSASSMLLCLALGCMAVRSYWVDERVACRVPYRGNHGYSELEAISGESGLLLLQIISYETASLPAGEAGVKYELYPLDLKGAGAFGWNHGGRAGQYWFWLVYMPYWMPITAAAVLPAAWFVTYRFGTSRRRLKQGLCLHCGYDLRASKERCPECGTHISAALASTTVFSSLHTR